MIEKNTHQAQPQDTANKSDIVTRARGNRRIDTTTISEIARLCAKQLTESEACRRLGVKPRQWFDWKTRHNRSEKFAELLEAFRADRIDSLVTKIESAADGVNMKQPDWRAAAALLKYADLKRFGDSPQVQVTNTTSSIVLSVGGLDNLKRIVNSVYATTPVLESKPAPRQIADAEIIEEP